MVDRSDDASCLLGLEGLAVERVVRTVVGVKIVQLVTDDPEAARCPVCRIAVDVGQGPGAYPTAGPAVRRASSRWCSGASGAGGAARRHVRGRRSPSRSGRCRPGCARRPGCGRRSRWRWRTAGISPRSLPRTGCRGRRCSGRSSCTARSSWSSPSRSRCWGWTRPGSAGRGGCPTATTTTAGCGGGARIRGRPGSSTSPASRPCWGRSTAGPAPRSRPGWPPAPRSSGPGSRWW